MFSAFNTFGRLGAAAGSKSLAQQIAAMRLKTWLDFGDISTMFQDDAGTTPVTSVGQSVGKVLDKSGTAHFTQSTGASKPRFFGSPAGENLCTDWMFLTGTGWTFGTGWTRTGVTAVASAATGNLEYAFSPTVGKDYLVVFAYGNKTGGSFTFSMGGVTSGAQSDANGTAWRIIRAVSTASLVITPTTFTGKIYLVGIYDVSTNNDCVAPYFLYFDGSQWLSAANTISAYPLTLVSKASTFKPATIPSSIALYQGDSDFKGIGASERSVDWKEGTISAYSAFASSQDSTFIAEFTGSANVSDNQTITGASTPNSNTFGTKTTVRVGCSRTAFAMCGRITGVMAADRVLSATEKATINTYYSADNSLIGWGDSMTAASLGSLGADGAWLMCLRTLANLYTENKGAGGETSTQIKSRFLADTTNKDGWTNIFWMGTNDAFSGDYSAWASLMLGNINACISGLTGRKRFLVLGITQAEGIDRPLDALDAEMLAAFGDRFVDVRAYLQALGDGSANDLADIAAGLVPRSLRADTIHLNDAGNQYLAQMLAAKLKTLGWV